MNKYSVYAGRMSRSSKVTERTVEEEVVECPLCQKSFPITVIQVHASNCGELSADIEQQSTVRHNTSKRRLEQCEDGTQMVCSSDREVKVARNTFSRNRRERTHPNFVSCVHCSGIFKEGDLYLLHVKDCQWHLRESSNRSSPNSRTPIGGHRSPKPSGSSSNHMRMTPPVTQSTSVFEQLKGVLEVKFHQGDIRDLTYRQPTTALLHIVNCVAVRPHGLSQIMADKYPYSNTYGTRRPIDKLNRACVNDRDVPGTIKICRSNIDSRTPIVVSVFGQFYMGKAVHDNVMSKRLVAQLTKGSSGGNRMELDFSFDNHLLNGVKTDTQENRIRWFQNSLKNLANVIAKENIKRVVFPYKIGCGLAGGNWERDYYPAIQEFNSSVSPNGVEVIIVNKVENAESDFDIAVGGSKRLSVPYSKSNASSYTKKSYFRKSY